MTKKIAKGQTDFVMLGQTDFVMLGQTDFVVLGQTDFVTLGQTDFVMLSNPLPHNSSLKTLNMAFENIGRKGQNAGNQHFLLFLPGFYLYKGQTVSFEKHSNSHL